jgi:hypothetical protein
MTLNIPGRRTAFAGIGRQLVECETDRLGRGRIQVYSRAIHRHPGPNKIRKVGKLGPRRVLDVNTLPLVPRQQVLVGRKCLDSLAEALDKIFRLASRGLATNCLHETKHVFGAMIDLAHQKPNVVIVSLPGGNVVKHSDEIVD